MPDITRHLGKCKLNHYWMPLHTYYTKEKKKKTMPSAGQDAEQITLLHTAVRTQYGRATLKNCLTVSYTVEQIPYDLAITFLDINPSEINTYVHTKTVYECLRHNHS